MKTRTSHTSLPCILSALCLVASPGWAETVVWQDNFDDGNGDSRWYADSGVWQMGSPTHSAGPSPNASGFRAYSGAYCATTGLTGNYPDNRISRLIRMQSFTVPAAAQFPRLRFWHWYNFACGDFGAVQIKVGSGAWQDLAQYSSAASRRDGTSSGVWARQSLDLSAYAGQTVQIGFYFETHSDYNCGTSTGPGWYVDDIMLVTGTPVFNSPEGFENGMGDWSVYGGTWEVGVPTSGPWAAHSGTNCAATVLGGNYSENTSGSLLGSPFVVPDQSPRLRFWHWYNFACGDFGKVSIRVVGGAWQDLAQYSSAASRRDGTSSGVWARQSLDLSAYAGQTVQIGFYFETHSDYNCGTSTGPGWYVDDIMLVTGTPVFNSPEGFENGMGDWSVYGGTWEVGVPTSGPWAAHSGTNCAATVLGGNYSEDTSGSLVGSPFVVPNQSPWLRFWHWYNFACGDFGKVSIRVVGGAWQDLAQFTSNGTVWTCPAYDLSGYAGQMVQIGFYFASHSDYNCGFTVSSGWYVDDVWVQNYVPPFPPPSIVVPPKNQFSCLGHSATFNVSASGTAPLSYQWYFNTNTLLIGATNATLTLTNLQATNAGIYSVVVSNPYGSTNVSAQLLINDACVDIEVVWFFRSFLYAGLNMRGKQGATYVLSCNSDLSNPTGWIPIATNVMSSSGWFYLDTGAPYRPRCFYKAVLKP